MSTKPSKYNGKSATLTISIMRPIIADPNILFSITFTQHEIKTITITALKCATWAVFIVYLFINNTKIHTDKYDWPFIRGLSVVVKTSRLQILPLLPATHFTTYSYYYLNIFMAHIIQHFPFLNGRTNGSEMKSKK